MAPVPEAVLAVTQLGGSRRCFRLAGRSWEAEEVDLARGVTGARPAPAGQVPEWTGRPGHFSRTVCERFLNLIKSARVPQGCDDAAAWWLAAVRAGWRAAATGGAEEGRWVWHTYAGGKINAVLARLVEHTTGWPTSSSNLTVKIRTTSRDVPERLVGVQKLLAETAEPFEVGVDSGLGLEPRLEILVVV